MELQNIPDAAARKVISAAKSDGWLKSRVASDTILVDLLMADLHAGEAEAVALALEMKGSYLLIDEKEGRTMARQVGLSVTGVLGVLLRAKTTGKLNALKPEIEALRKNARFFIAPALESAVLAEAGEEYLLHATPVFRHNYSRVSTGP